MNSEGSKSESDRMRSLIIIAIAFCVGVFATEKVEDDKTLAAPIELLDHEKEILSSKIFEALTRLNIESGQHIVLLTIAQATKQILQDNIYNIRALLGPNPEECTLTLLERVDEYQRLDVMCGERSWHVIREPSKRDKRDTVVEKDKVVLEDVFEKGNTATVKETTTPNENPISLEVLMAKEAIRRELKNKESAITVPVKEETIVETIETVVVENMPGGLTEITKEESLELNTKIVEALERLNAQPGGIRFLLVNVNNVRRQMVNGRLYIIDALLGLPLRQCELRLLEQGDTFQELDITCGEDKFEVIRGVREEEVTKMDAVKVDEKLPSKQAGVRISLDDELEQVEQKRKLKLQ